ncbi:hypothetical protein AVEN_49964-1 [Araneus ventricosus]|uniref:Uncharacterized protein n=1 Tax=Araneus ventricosus TaxID=182803 RepID=A0A4Y2IUE6_ARAVE|nr:hypothetical protein AVEN_12475-1 [Araneus ventricosus]GBO18043.1 hypothetical protein AVEN_49964-1 [Araneus ventricosus]
MELELDNSDIDEIVKERSQDLTTEEFTGFHCVLQQDDVEETNSKRMGNSSIVENRHSNKAMALRSKNVFNDNAF